MSTLSPDQIARPDFAVVVRGYDRAQVEAYFGRTLERLADADNRVAMAERERDQLVHEVDELRATVAALEERVELPVPQSMSEFGGRMGELMENAIEAARELRVQAEREARERREAGTREAQQLVEEARAEAERIIERARSSQRAVEESISDLRAARGDALAELAALHDRLADVLATPPSGGVHEAGTVLETEAPTSVGVAVTDGPDAPTIVQPAVPAPAGTGTPDETAQQPAVSGRA